MDPEVSLPKYVLEQSEWYAGKARSNRGRFFWIRGYQIVVASVIPLVSLFGAWSAQRYVSAALGASIAIAEGLQQLGQFQQCLNQPPNQAMSVSSAFDPSKTFVFVDGGVTPHNNPAFLLYRMATEPPIG